MQQQIAAQQLQTMLREQQQKTPSQNRHEEQEGITQQQFISSMLAKRGKSANQSYTPDSSKVTPVAHNRQQAQVVQIGLTPQYMQPSNQVNNFRVVIRVRPPLPRERGSSGVFRPVVEVSPDRRSVAIMEYLGQEIDERERARDIESNPHLCIWQSYSFDYVYDPNSTQEEVYLTTAKPAVQSVLEGYNATILAYGQTGTGKTHTMEGFKYNGQDPSRGIVPRSMEEIFQFIQMQSNKNFTFMVRASYLQIYNEVISDLLKVERTSLQIREDKKKGVFVEGLSEWAVRSPNEIYSLLQRGALSRATATTKMNDMSSRSHAVFIIIVEQMTTMQEDHIDPSRYIKVGKLNLVDLAGSERVRLTGATGKRLEESKKINQSLSCLGNVIAALTDLKSRTHIPYRDSKLTRILEDSLGGNCKTTMMAMITPSADAFAESQSTLKFATRAKKIKNEARINEDVDQRALLRKYEIELKKLKLELQQKESLSGGNGANVQILEEERRRAEADKNAAISALEQRSKEFMQAQEQRRALEEKIKAMNSQMLIGGKKIEDTPQFRNALEQQASLIRQEYQEKISEIERERGQIEEDKLQVDRYKHILHEYRDIMTALTSRLNERDEQIIQLQEELEAYDRIHRETEQIIETKQKRCQQLEVFIQEQCHKQVPYNSIEANEDLQSDKMYQPFDESHGGYLTADQKIQELEQILQARELELDEAKLQIEQPQEQLQLTKDLNLLVMSSLSDLNSFNLDQHPKLLSAQGKIQEMASLLGHKTMQPAILQNQSLRPIPQSVSEMLIKRKQTR